MLGRPDRPGSIVEQVSSFVTLGNKVNGWAGVCHGGVVATLLDEVPTMLRVTRVNAPGRSFVTASLNVKYLEFVKTPGTIMVVSKLKRWEYKGEKCTWSPSLRTRMGRGWQRLM